MRDLLQQYLDHEISRREFGLGLAALGLSAAAVEAVLADAGDDGGGMPREGIKVEGTGADVLLATFAAADLKYLFGTTATGMSALFDAMTLQPGVEWIMSVAESQATAMAHGYELASGGTAAVFVPGVAIPSTMNMLYNAWKDRSSLVVYSDAQPNTIPFRNMFQQMEDWVEPMIQFTKARWQIDSAEHISELSRRAFKVAGTPPGGPVHVRLPSNVLGARKVVQRVYPQSRFSVPVEMRPKPELIEATAKALLAAKRPMVTAGPEVTRAGATEDLVALAELIGMPVAQGYSVYGDFPWRHPLWGGFHGLGVPRSLVGTDVFINLGGAMPGPGIFTAPPPKSAMVVDARVEYDAIGTTHPVDIAIAAGVRETVVDLADALKSMATEERLRQIAEPRMAAAREEQSKRDAQRRDKAREHWDASPMSWPRISAELDLALDETAIIVPELDYRTPFYWMDFDLGKKMVVGQTTGFALGWGIAAAQGVKIAQPDRQVTCLVGDGALLFGEIEALWSAARYDIPIIIVVFNNLSYDNERNRIQQLSPLYSKKDTREQWRDISGWLGDPNVDFVGLAKSFEIDGMRAATPAEFRDALKRATAATREGRPYLIDAMVMQVDRQGRPAEYSWYPTLSIAERRGRKV